MEGIGRRKNPVQGNERIAVVGHSTLMAALTATGVGPNDVDHAKGDDVLQGFYWSDNCEMQPFKP